MRKFLMIALNTVALISIAAVAFASEGGNTYGDLVYFGAAIGMAIAAAGCGIGQGLGLKAACEGTARNPEASNKITVALILGLAFVESLSIYALVVNLMLLTA